MDADQNKWEISQEKSQNEQRLEEINTFLDRWIGFLGTLQHQLGPSDPSATLTGETSWLILSAWNYVYIWNEGCLDLSHL